MHQASGTHLDASVPVRPPHTLLLGALVTLASFATDMGLPVLEETARSLGVTAATTALTMSLFMAGFAVGPLVMAPISDRYGRRRLLLAGCGAFALFGALGAFATSLSALLLWRFIMGAGAGTVQVLVVATVRDHFAGAAARIRQSYVNLAAGIAPIIAPTLVVWVAALGGWRAIYAALSLGTIVAVALLLAVLSRTTWLGPGTIVTLIVVSHVGHAVVRANSVRGALEPMPEIAGVASAVITGLQMIVGAVASAAAAVLFDGRTATAMTGTMLVCASSAFAIYWFVVRPATLPKSGTRATSPQS